MGVDLYSGLRVLRIQFWWESSNGGERLPFHDRHRAQQFLARLGAAGHGAEIRRLTLGHLPTARLDDQGIFEQLSWWLVSGRLRIEARPVDPLIARDRDEVEAPVEARRIEKPLPEEVEAPVEDQLPPDIVDSSVQARALREAAEEGLPFCEECEKAKKSEPEPDDMADVEQASQAATLVAAAKSGAPFCAECEKAKKRPPNAPPDEAPAADPEVPEAERVDEAAQAAALSAAAKRGAAFCEECEKAKQARASAGGSG